MIVPIIIEKNAALAPTFNVVEDAYISSVNMSYPISFVPKRCEEEQPSHGLNISLGS